MSGGFLCSVCGEKFPEENSFIKHIKDHVENSGKRKSPKCDEFQYGSDNNSSLGSAGIRNRTDSGCIPLETCNPHEKIRATLKYKITYHSRGKPFKCPDCSYATARKSDFKYHLRTHSGEKLFKCSYCSYAAVRKSQLNIHMTYTHLHSGEKLIKCPDCLCVTANKSNFKVHNMKTRLEEKTFQCSNCPNAAIQKSHLKVHVMSIQSGDKPFNCPDCSYATVGKSQLDVHMKTHSGEKPCKLSFVIVNKYPGREPKLELHHEEEAITVVPDVHKCKICDKKYSYASSLRKHIRISHRARAGRPLHLCGTCGRGYTEKHRLNSHVKTHDGQRERYPCDLCNKDFSQRNNLARHMQRKHRDD